MDHPAWLASLRNICSILITFILLEQPATINDCWSIVDSRRPDGGHIVSGGRASLYLRIVGLSTLVAQELVDILLRVVRRIISVYNR